MFKVDVLRPREHFAGQLMQELPPKAVDPSSPRECAGKARREQSQGPTRHRNVRKRMSRFE